MSYPLQVMCIGGNLHATSCLVQQWPEYTNVGGYSQPDLQIEGEPYIIEMLFLRDGSIMRFLRSPEISIREAAELLMALVMNAAPCLSNQS